MDCVGCDRCRLWGKLQAAGYGTALKIVLSWMKRRMSNLESWLLLCEDQSWFHWSILLTVFLNPLKRSSISETWSEINWRNRELMLIHYQAKIRPKRSNLKRRRIYWRRRCGSLWILWFWWWIEYKYQTTISPFVYLGRPEWELWKDAFKFIFQSYIDFPKNVYNLFLINTNHYWNVLVGRDAQMVKDQVVRGGQLESLNADL